MLRSQKDVWEELTGRSGNGTDVGQTFDRVVAVQRKLGLASREGQSASGRHHGPKSDEGWRRGRLVGVVEG